jgi:hypothetical protein
MGKRDLPYGSTLELKTEVHLGNEKTSVFKIRRYTTGDKKARVVRKGVLVL